jgi:hypothetical protein
MAAMLHRLCAAQLYGAVCIHSVLASYINIIDRWGAKVRKYSLPLIFSEAPFVTAVKILFYQFAGLEIIFYCIFHLCYKNI